MKELNRNNIEDIAALTSMQEGMLFHYLKDPGSDAYFEQLSLSITGDIDIQIFKQAWNVVIRANEMLRTVFRWERLENPIQIVLKEHQFQLKYYDFSGKKINEALRALEEIKVKDRKKKFDLREVPFRVTLCKIQASKNEMMISNHHILYDGWSNGIILKEFFEAYEALICKKHAHLFREHPKAKFKEFIKWNQNRDIEKEEKFWRSYLQGIDKQIGLSVKRSKRRVLTGTRNHQVRLEREEKHRIEDFVKRNKLTLASLFYTAWGLLLQKYNSSDDVIFGTTVSGRTAKIDGIEDLVGLFINTLPLRIQTTTDEIIKDLLHQVDTILRVREEFENSSLVDIRKYSDIDTKGELFDSIVILENYPLKLSLNNCFIEEKGRLSLAVESYSMVEETHYDLTVGITVFEELEVSLLCNEELFDDECIINMSHHFIKIIRQMVTTPIGKISDLEIITREEKNRILYDFNNTGADFPKTRTIHQLFEEQVERSPVRTALIGTAHEAQSTRMHLEGTRGLAPLSRLITITYSELNERFNQLAGLLREKGVQPDAIVAIMMERSVEMIIGIFGILKAGGAYLPIDPGYPAERIRYMMEDSNAGVLVTTSGLSEKIEKLLIVNCQLLIVNEMGPNCRRLNDPPKEANSINNYQLTIYNLQLEQTNLAYLIYTSGSTGNPKGVMIGHYSVINRLNWMQAAYPIGPGDVILQKTPVVFDVSVWELFWWGFQGACLCLLNPGDEKDAGAIVEVIERFGVTTMHFVPSMLNAFLDYLETLLSKIESGRCQSLLKSLKQVFSSGESLGVVQVERFHALFKRCNCPKLINLYGPTEATVDVSYFDCSGKEKLEKVPIGKPIHNIQLYVLDSELHLQPIGIPGELVISGIGLARGYLNQPELIFERFKRAVNSHLSLVISHSSLVSGSPSKLSPNDQCPMTNDRSSQYPIPPLPHSPIYLTGDLARWLPDGNIEFLGRMDQQVKVRGFRIELGEIENHLLVTEEIKEAVVLAREDRPGDKYLCAYIVSEGEVDRSILRDHLSGRLPGYMIPSYFVQLEKMPLTPNGKVDRKALPGPEISVGKDYAAPRDKIEKKLVEIWSEILCRDVLHASQLRTLLGIDDNFFELGGHSLNATRLVSRIHKDLNVIVPLQQIFILRTIRGLASYLKGMRKSIFPSIEMVEKREYYPLTPAQKRMYILHQANPDGLVYNMPKVMVLEGDLDKRHIEAVFQELIRRHESLRTSFHLVEEKPVQVVHDEAEFEIEYYGMKEIEVKVKEERSSLLEGTRGLAPLFIKEFICPFDLSQAPLMRVRLIRKDDNQHILMLDMHHIISDGVSLGLFIRNFMAVYSGKDLGPIGISYKDFSRWQNSSQGQETIKNQEAYWLEQFEDEIPVLNLPLDYGPSKVLRFEGHTLHFELGREDTERLNIVVKREGITLFMSLLATFYILVGKLSGQDDILVGTPSGGRKHPDLENIMGMFVNTLVLRSFPSGYKKISDFLKEIKETTLGAFENRDYPFEELVRHLVKERDASRNPLFDIMFTLQNLDIPFIRIPGLTVTPLEYDIGISKFDLTISGEKTEEKMLFTVEYNRRLFKETTIKRFIRYFQTIVSQVIRVPGISISEIELISAEEKEEILFRFNDTWFDYPVHKAIYQLFEEQVQRWPDKIAVSGPGVGMRFIVSISYRELNETSNQQAHLLRQKGVVPDVIVGLMMDRSVEMIIGILGILKYCGVYLPIDPDYPGERINYMLADSGAKFLVTSWDLSKEIKFEKEIIYLSDAINRVPTPPHQHLPPSPATCLAYIIYTSGSTGKPKGVMVEHSSVVNLSFAQKRRFKINTSDRILQFSSICFDASIEQIFIALFSGAALVLIHKDTLLDTNKFVSFLSKHSITHINAVPSFLNHVGLKERERYSLRRIISGGEVCPVSLARKMSHWCDFYNQYGPTETTVTSIAVMIEYEAVDETLPRLPIGRPIDNTMVYVLDKWMKPVCLGAVGELYIGGVGVARGYLNNPELTAEKFHHALWDYQDYHDEKIKSFFGGPGGRFFKKVLLAARGRLYKTGDLGRWLVDGNIEFLGRVDHQVKIRGFRIELGEIESHLLKYPGINNAVVIIRTGNDGDKHLCAYITAGKTAAAAGVIDITKLREFLAASLPDYMIPSYFLQLEQLPLTFNGKVDRKALPEPGRLIGKDYAPPRDKIEKKLGEIWWEILCGDASHASQLQTSLSINDNFFELGGHSLKATILASRIRKEFKIKFSLSKVFRGPTIKEMSDYIRSARRSIYQEIQPVEKKDYYPQSSAQKRLYFLQQMDLNSTSYNMPLFLPLGKEKESTKLEPVVKKLIARHESLRTSFVRVNDIPVQRVQDSMEFEIEHYELQVTGAGDRCRGEDERTRGLAPLFIKEFIRPFDLSQAPLLRVGLIELPHIPAVLRSHPRRGTYYSQEGKEQKYILMVDMHHIISDGTSTSVLVEDFLALYPGNRLPGLRLQYKDFSQWQNRLFSGSELKAQENYWKEVYWSSGEFPRLQLPADYKRPEVFTFAGDNFGFLLERTDAFAFNALGTRNGATLYMNILAVLNVLFYKITSQTDIVIGTGIASRPHADLQGIIGMFVNTLIMRNYPHGEETYELFLKEVAGRSVEAFENQDLPFEELVEKLEPQRDPSRNPLFDISMVVQNFKRAGASSFSPGNFHPFAVLPTAVEKSSYDADYKNATSKFDMTFFIHENRDNIEVDIEYYTAIFKKETIQRLASHFINLVKSVIKSPTVRLKDIDIISEEEKNHLLYELNDTVRAWPMDKTLPGLFADQVERTPDHMAIVGPSISPGMIHESSLHRSPLQITYRELNKIANQLANYLVHDRQIQQESLVGILMERSIHQVVALLGVLKSGGAYLPLDTSLPEEGIKNIIDDACLGIIISQKRFIRVLNRLQWEWSALHTFLCLDSADIYSEVEIEKNELMDEKLWDFVAESATDEITGGGWFSSYTGLPFFKKEMEEYGDNILKKLLPLLHREMKVLEIGCGSGITMYRIAPSVGFYYGTDLSNLIITHNKKRVKAEGYKNIVLSTLPAHKIDELVQRDFDLVIINSVIQSFHGHNYLRQVLCKAIDRLKQQGYLFIGDILDHDLKADLIREMSRFKYSDKGTGKTKTDWNADLFVSRSFFEDLSVQWREISTVEFSNKIYTVENELTKFRYDVLITIDKLRKGNKTDKTKSRKKYQHDGKVLDKFPGVPAEIAINVKPENLAYVIYTSGSTGSSKGVMVTHRNVSRLVKNANYIDYIDFKGRERFLLTGAFSFDITTFEIWGLLLNGIYLYMVDKDVILEGERLQEEVVKHGISIMHFTPQLFNQYAVNFPGIFAALDCFLIGGDIVSAGVLSKVRNKYNHLKILHMYGPTENTTFSTYFPVESDYDTAIPIGKPISNTTIYILNKYHQLQPIGAAGELYTGGDGVACGYLNNPFLTFERFTNYKLQNTNYKQTTKYNAQNYKKEINKKLLRGVQGGGFLEKRPPGRRRLYRTGDLGRWLLDGNIEFLGRADFQVKIRGFRIELEEIRNQLLKHELITEVVVIDRHEEDGGKYLCAYFVSKKVLDLSELNDFLSHRLPDYMVPSYFVQLEKIPLTSNGKVDRKALPGPGISVRKDYTAPRDEVEKKLVEIWAELLGRDASHSSQLRSAPGIDDNFFAIGGHSLKATILTVKIHKELGIKVPLAEIFKHQTIRELSGYIQRVDGGRQEYIFISPVEKKDYYILSSGQKRLYVLHQLDDQGIGYNLSAVVLLEGKLDIGKFTVSFKQLIQQHESLRTSFHLVDEEPVQVVHHEVEFEIEYDRSLVNCQCRGEVSSPIKIGTIIREFVQPFDLSRTPLLRVGLIRLNDNQHILVLDMHHIITDGTSLGIIINELIRINVGEELLPLKLQYKDYSEWQHNDSQEQAVKVQEKYWLKQFVGDIPVLNLPYDYPRPPVQGFAGGTIKFKLEKAEASALKALALKQETTLYMLLLSIYYVFLAKLSGQEDIIVGTPTAGRRHADLQQIIGMFVNTLALRNFPTGDKTFKKFLEELKHRTLEAYENQEFQFEELVEKVVVERDASRNPLFDTMFALQNLDIPELEIRGLKVKPYDHEAWTAVFDLVLEVNEIEEGLLFKFSYSTGLFREETIQRLIGYFKSITAAVLKHSEIKLSQIEMIPEEEKRKILVDFNERETRYPKAKMLHELFAEQVKRAPDNIALVAPQIKYRTHMTYMTYISYRQLNEKCDQLACLLKERGVLVDSIAAIMMERSVEMIIGILGILKAGGAYLPIDPEYPEERIFYMLADSKAKLLLSDNPSWHFNCQLSIVNCQLSMNEETQTLTSALTSTCQVSPANLAYIIYTSGTTGKPKGVLVSHANVSPLLHWGKRYLGISRVDRVIQNFSYVFDGSVWEIFIALMTGAGLYMIPKDMVPDPGALVDFINANAITTMLITPTQLQYLIHIGKRLDTLRYLFIGAEKLTVVLVNRSIESVAGNCRIFNMYGPTEATVISTAMEIDRQYVNQYNALSSIPIGIAVGNTVLLILDSYWQLCPIGVTGELVIAGDAVSRGYLNSPELTNKNFCLRWSGGALFEKTAPVKHLDSPRKNFSLKMPVKNNMQSCNHAFMPPPQYPTTPLPHYPIYKTGDLARWLGDGTIEFLGRLDHQVKIRGFRIELAEIENQLLDHQDIREAIVIDRESIKGEKYLCAYIVPEDINHFDNNSSYAMVSQLRSYLSRELPDYMIPSYFVQLDNIPLNPNGKLDRKALPEPEVRVREAHIAPGNELEKTLADIWAEVLGIEKNVIGIDSDFFQLGGHSLKATFMLAKIRNEFNIDISLGEIFKTPNIRGIASLIKAVHWAAHQKKDINQEREEIIL